MRFRVSELLMVTAVIAIAIACLQSPTYWVSNAFATCVVLVFLAAVAVAIGSTGTPKYFWIGFAVIGMTYAHYANLTKGSDEAGVEVVHASLVEAFVTRLVPPYPDYSMMPGMGMSGGISGGMSSFGMSGMGGGGFPVQNTVQQSRNQDAAVAYQSAICTTHCLIGFLLAWMGGHLCCFARKRSEAGGQEES